VRRYGEEMLFQSLKEHNTEVILEAKPKRIVTSDPHAYNALKNDYVGLPKVEHVIEVIAAGIEKGSTLEKGSWPTQTEISLRLDAAIDFTLDADGLLASGPRAQWMVLRSLAAQYDPALLAVNVHLRGAPVSPADQVAQANALLDLDAGPVHFDHDQQPSGLIRLRTSDGRLLDE